MIYGHGGEVYNLARELNVSPKEIKDFSTNISHYPLPSQFWDYLQSTLSSIRLLPEVDNGEVIQLFSKRYNLNPSWVLAGNGSTEFIYIIPRILKPKRIIILNPTYSDYKDAALLEGIEVKDFGPFIQKNEYSVFFSENIKHLDGNDLIFLCNPNNPTGQFIDNDLLFEIINHYSHIFWVIDESYAPFVDSDQNSSLIYKNLPDNVFILRSFSKIYGLPGIRLGFLISKNQIMEKLKRNLPPWNINSLTQSIAMWILKNLDLNYEESVRKFYQEEKRFFLEEIEKITTLQYIRGDTHYLLFEINHPVYDGKHFKKELGKKGILIRVCGNFKGLNEKFIRIGLRNREDNLLLLKEIADILSRHL